ncbi:hypothetical protein EV182_001523, partial [Spiromyces aspiralis]
TGMHPRELYEVRLRDRKVTEPLLLSVLAVASRYSDDPRVQQTPSYLSGSSFYERAKAKLADLFERDMIENILTLNNLAMYAVGLPVANRGWYFSGIAMRMSTQMSLQKIDAPGRIPGASMLSGPGMESARRAFWTTVFLESLASFASGEPPSTTQEDIHVGEPCDESGVSKYLAQLSVFLLRVSKLNGNRHPESVTFSPEYTTLHHDMVAWYESLPDQLRVRQNTVEREIAKDPQTLAAKVFLHCVYNAAIIALHQPRINLVRVDPVHPSASADATASTPKTTTIAPSPISAGGSSGGAKGHRTGPDASVISANRHQASSPSQSRRGDSTTSSQPDNDRQWQLIAQQKCFSAACTITEILVLTRHLDVRYHLVTVGFSIFMAGVVYVTALSCTQPNSPESQFSMNCLKQHMAVLEKLGKYFAFHYMMAKHIQTQLSGVQKDVPAMRSTATGTAPLSSADTTASSSPPLRAAPTSSTTPHSNLAAASATVASGPSDRGARQQQQQQSPIRLDVPSQQDMLSGDVDIDFLSLLSNPPSSLTESLSESMLNLPPVANVGAMASGSLFSSMLGQLMPGVMPFNLGALEGVGFDFSTLAAMAATSGDAGLMGSTAMAPGFSMNMPVFAAKQQPHQRQQQQQSRQFQPPMQTHPPQNTAGNSGIGIYANYPGISELLSLASSIPSQVPNTAADNRECVHTAGRLLHSDGNNNSQQHQQQCPQATSWAAAPLSSSPPPPPTYGSCSPVNGRDQII